MPRKRSAVDIGEARRLQDVGRTLDELESCPVAAPVLRERVVNPTAVQDPWWRVQQPRSKHEYGDRLRAARVFLQSWLSSQRVTSASRGRGAAGRGRGPGAAPRAGADAHPGSPGRKSKGLHRGK